MSLTEQDLLPYFNSTAANHRETGRQQESREKEQERRTNLTMRLQDTNSPEDAKIVEAVLNLFYNARAHRKPLVNKWNNAYQMLRGRFWNDSGRPNFLPSPQIPEIFPIVRSTVGWMTDRRFHNVVSVAAAPFTGYNQYWEGVARDLETVMDASWHVHNEEGEVTIALWDSFTYGTGVLKTTWDNSLAGGMGDAKISRIDPFGFYPDPAARNMHDGNYYIEVKNMSLQELDRRFPGALKKFRGEGNIVLDFDEAPTQFQTSNNQIPRANPAAIGSSSGVYGRPGGPGQLSARSVEDDGVTVFECWVREHEIYEVDVIDPEWSNQGNNSGKPKSYKEQHVLDTWRVYVVAGNHVLLNARADDIWDHGQHPYSRFVPYDLGEFWGVGLVELLSSSQEAINRLLAAAIQNIELLGNPILLEDNNSNVQRAGIINKPGQRLTKNRGSDVSWMDPPRIQSDIPLFLQYFLQRMETVSGLAAITKGKEPQGRPAEGTMDAVQEAAFVGIRMALRSLEYTLRDAGYKKASLIIENYTVPRMLAITGPTGERSTLALRARHFMVPTKNGAAPMQYQLLVDAGAGTDTSRKVREDKAITLFTLGALDLMSLYEALQWPNKEEVYQRVLAQMQSGMFQPPGKRQKARA